jgi:hypothetical protein
VAAGRACRCRAGRGRLLGLKVAGLLKSSLKRAPTTAVVLLAAGLGLSAGAPTPASAEEFAPPELLEALKARLLDPPDCVPSCADIPSIDLPSRKPPRWRNCDRVSPYAGYIG